MVSKSSHAKEKTSLSCFAVILYFTLSESKDVKRSSKASSLQWKAALNPCFSWLSSCSLVCLQYIIVDNNKKLNTFIDKSGAGIDIHPIRVAISGGGIYRPYNNRFPRGVETSEFMAETATERVLKDPPYADRNYKKQPYNRGSVTVYPRTNNSPEAPGLQQIIMTSKTLLQDDTLLELMQEHSKVSRIGINNNPARRCRCCDGELVQNQLPLLCKVSEFVHAGVLFPLYFEFIIYFSGLLFICSLFCIINICLNLLGNYCYQNSSFPCISSITNSLGPEELNYLNIQTTVNHLFIIAALLYLEFASFILKQRRKDLEIPVEHHYSVLYKGDPMMSSLQLFETCRELENRIEVYSRKQNKILKLGIIMRIYTSEFDENPPSINDEIEYNELPEVGRQTWKDDNLQLQRRMQADFSGKVIMVFQNPVQAQHFGVSKVEEIADASDIIWQNIGLKGEKNKKIIMLIAIGCLMGITFLIILFIKKWIKKISTGQHQVFVIFLNLCIATIVAVFNSIQGIVIRACAKRELYPYHSKFFRIVARRLSYVFFINMVMTTFFANFLFFFEQRQDRNFLLPIDYPGLVNDFFFLFLTNSYMSSIFNYFDIFFGIKLLKRLKIIKDPKHNKFSPEQTKFIFEGHPVDMGLRYGNVMKTLFFTASICPFVPSGPIFSLLGMFICYWVDKYLLLRRYTCRHELSGDFAQQMTEFSKFFIIMFAFSNFILQLIPLNNQGEPDSSEFSWINVYISSGFCLITLVYKFYFPKIKSYFTKSKTPSTNEFQCSYSEALKHFRSKYEDKLNMITVTQLARKSLSQEPICNRERVDSKLMESVRVSMIQNHFDEDTI